MTGLTVAADDPRVGMRGHSGVRHDGDRVCPERLPARERGWLIDPVLDEKQRMPAGVRLEFHTDARALSWPVRVGVPDGVDRPPAPFDIVVDGVRCARQTVADAGEVAVRLPDGDGRKLVRIWLPQFGLPELGPLTLTGATVLTPAPARPDLVLYGSSITQCSDADGPSETWPALVADAGGWDLRCLGFAGECHLDPIVARFIRDTPADLISLCVGVNVHGRGSFHRRSLAPALAGFIATIRDGHPDTPMVLMTPISTAEREHAVNTAGLTLTDVRAEVVRVHEFLRTHGEEHLRLINGPDILGPDETGLLGDGLHPTAEGYRLMGRRLIPHFGPAPTTG